MEESVLLKPGEKIHVLTRRRFENDIRRHFVGVVKESNESTVKIEGSVFVVDSFREHFERRPEIRTRIIGLADSGNIINVIPKNVDLKALNYKISKDNHLVITDDKSFQMDINEFGLKR
jgi:predicted SnoaL-like aldol condensation-catalyzing enzyme